MLRAILAKGAEAYGFTGDFWSRARVQELIRQEFDIEYHVNTVGDLLRDMGITLQVPVTKNYRQKPEDVAEFKEKRLPAIKKKARDEGYVICYLDEAAFSFFPSVWRTYAPKGQTPVVTHGPLYGGLQVMSLITENGRLHYQTKPGSFTGSDVVDFLRSRLPARTAVSLSFAQTSDNLGRCADPSICGRTSLPEARGPGACPSGAASGL